MPSQSRMTREEFEAFVSGNRGRGLRGGQGPLQIFVPPPYDVVPCRCGDVNCHGWKFVERQAAPAIRDLTYEMVHG
jgi:hypothetical protein